MIHLKFCGHGIKSYLKCYRDIFLATNQQTNKFILRYYVG